MIYDSPVLNPRALGKAALKRASGKVLGALSRADELGGKVREKLAELNAARQAMRAAAAPSPKPAPPPPASPVVKAPPAGLGDPARAVQVFGRASCPWSGRVLALLESVRLDHAYFDLDGYGSDTVLRELTLETKQDTVPYVYVRGRFIGGYNALDELHRLGHLEYLTLAESERSLHPMHGRIEVAPRLHDGERIPG